ncbi:MAG: amidohydrolase family protein [Planctomycetota bacterium]
MKTPNGNILRGLAATVALGLATPSVTAQDRPVALTNARILTQVLDDEGNPKVIENGTILLRGGEIDDVGENLFLPPGTHKIDLNGGSVMPGLVHAWSNAGLSQGQGGGRTVTIGGRGRRPRIRQGGGGRTGNAAAETLDGKIYARQDIFSDLLETGVTTLVVHPPGRGFPGYAAHIDLTGEDESRFLIDDEVFVTIVPGTDKSSRDLLKTSFTNASKLVEKRNKPKPEPKPEPETPAEGEGETPAEGEGEKPAEGEGGEGEKPPVEEPKPEPKPEEKPQENPRRGGRGGNGGQRPDNPNTVVLADLLEGKKKGFLNLSTASDMLHMKMALGDLEVSYPCVLVADRLNERAGSLMAVIEDIKALEPTVLIQPRLTAVPFTQTVQNPARALHENGVTIGFVIGDSPNAVRNLWFQLMELVRYGLPAEVALAGVTRVPAQALGVDGEVGTIETGKRANLLVFTGDPLDPTSRLAHVFHQGRQVGHSEEDN